MKRKLLIGCGGLAVAGAVLLGGLAVGGQLLDSEVDLSAERQLTAAPEALYPHLTTFAGLVTWWDQAGVATGSAGQTTLVVLPGPTEGVGMQVEFKQGSTTTERWALTAAEPPHRAVYAVDFQGFTVERTITLTANEQGTWATWEESATIDNPLMRYFTLLPQDALLSNFYTALTALDSVASER